jgi:DNA-binding NarL/FixJ family response regulator
VCLLTTVHPERALSRALVQHLAQELPDLRFTLAPRGPVHLVWVCGYEGGNAGLIHELRRRFPRAALLVTSRDAGELWIEEVLGAGADEALSWPVDLAHLSRLIRGRLVRRPA